MLRFVKALKSRIQSSVTDVPGTLSLGATEISEAQKLWIIESQLFAKDTNFDTWMKQFFWMSGLYMHELEFQSDLLVIQPSQPYV